MTKNKYLIIAGFIIVTVVVIMAYKEAGPTLTGAVSITGTSKPIPHPNLSSNKISAPYLSSRTPASSSYSNKPSPLWQVRLKSSLKEQAGDSLKDIQVKKERSLIWTRDEVPLSVESVIITLTNQQNEESSFRALVDSQTGKVLETWDRTIFDPADVRAGFHIKLKDHYSN